MPQARQWRCAKTQPRSRPQYLRHIRGDGLLQFPRLGVQRFQFLVQGFELLLEVLVADLLARRDADVAAGVELPALGFDLGQRRRLAQAGDVAVDKPLSLRERGWG